MMYVVITNGRLSTSDHTFEEAAQALAEGHRNGDVVRIRVRTYGRQERDITAAEQQQIVNRATELLNVH